MTDGSPAIKVLVACHKPIACPESDLYLPIQLGAASSAPIAGMQPDSEGENISERNFSFCELSAQYWGWKNLEADYIGLCHYRRYFCFDGLSHPKNDHAQIEIPCLSPASISRYRLDDEKLMRSIIEQHDVIIPERWDIRSVPTPLGPQPTIRRHMVAYGLMDSATLDLLAELCENLQPAYAPYVEAYLNGHTYQGYNCFIMKRTLFDRFCSFEFDVLKAFDSQFNYENLTTTKKRIAGYLGEILVSAFVMKLEDEGDFDIAQLPLTFFENTPAPVCIGGVSKADEAALVWRFNHSSAHLLVPCLESLAETLHGQARDLTLIVPPGFDAAEAVKLARLPENLSITWATWPAIENYRILDKELDEEDEALIAPFMLPWLMPHQNRVYWVDGPALFEEIEPEFDGKLCAGQNIFLQRELNKPALAKAALLHDERGRHGIILGTHVLAFDLATLRNALSANEIVDLYLSEKAHALDELNRVKAPEATSLVGDVACSQLLVDLGFSALPFSVASLGLFENETRTWANEDSALSWLNADTPTITVFYKDGLPDAARRILHADRFWNRARSGAAYEALLIGIQDEPVPSLRDKLLPEGSRRRSLARSLVMVAKARTAADPL